MADPRFVGMRALVGAAGLAAALCTPLRAQEDDVPDRTERHASAQTAGLRALYTCTGLFTAGLTPERLEADIFASSVRTASSANMPVAVDPAAKTVSITFLPDMPPRVAAWRPSLGCTQLPIGAPASAAQYLPRLAAGVTPPNFDDQPWPKGDQGGVVKLAAPTQAALDAVVAKAFDPKTYGGVTWAVIVVKDGKIVAERYDRGYDMHTPQRTNSAAKSMAASVVGVAVKQGLVNIKAPAPLPEWHTPGDPRGKITLENLLHMASGLYTEEGGDPQQEVYQSGGALAERSARGSVDSRPGARWLYAGSDTNLSVRSVRMAMKDDARFWAFPYRELFWKVGMTRTTAEMDWNGDYLMSGQMWSTARDFARFGLLYLNDGKWGGEQILPAGWAKYVATPAPAQPGGGRGYGAQFWLYGPQQGLPEGSYSASGARGQYSMIIPSAGVVVVRRGFDVSGAPGGFSIARFSADVLGALGQTGAR